MTTRNEAISEQDKQDMFSYLDDLRESGATNMFGAAPYVQREFRIDIIDARQVLSEWMETFSERHSKNGTP